VGLLKFGTTFNETEHKQQPNSLHNDPWDEFKFIMYSFALEGEITPTKRVTIVPGISYEKIDYRKVTGTYGAVGKFKHPQWPGRPLESKDQEAFNPQISLIFDPVDYLSLSARIAKKTRFPKIQELYSSGGGNFELEPERAVSYEIGGNYLFPQQRGRVNLALFFNDIDNYIHRINNRSMFRNISEVEIQGVDLGFYLRPGGGLTSSLGWSYLWKAEDKMHNVDLPETPKHKFNFDLGYDFDFGLRANLFGIYAGKRPVYDNSYSRIGDLESYTVFNFKISQDLGKIDVGNSWFHPFELYGAVYNIGDENYFSEPAFPAPGRSFWAGITLKM